MNFTFFKYPNLLYSYYTPDKVKSILSPVILFLGRIATLILYLIRSSANVYVLNGKEKNSGNELIILYITHSNNLVLMEYVSRMAYNTQDVKKQYICNIRGWRLSSYIADYKSIAHIIFIETPQLLARIFSRKGYFIIPKKVHFRLDLSKPLEQIFSSTDARHNIKRVQKGKYSYEITHKHEEFDHFYFEVNWYHCDLKVKICHLHPGIWDFLKENPFIFIHEKELNGLVTVDTPEMTSAGTLAHLYKFHNNPGLARLVALSRTGFTSDALSFAQSMRNPLMTLITGSELKSETLIENINRKIKKSEHLKAL